jgi:hypothetical protein
MPDQPETGAICGPGPYTHLVVARCPWCCLGDDTTTHAFREVYGGYEAPDLICGACGQPWSDDAGLAHPSESEREENIALVAGMASRGIVAGPSPLPSSVEREKP